MQSHFKCDRHAAHWSNCLNVLLCVIRVEGP
jgi:hypothetical protein